MRLRELKSLLTHQPGKTHFNPSQRRQSVLRLTNRSKKTGLLAFVGLYAKHECVVFFLHCLATPLRVGAVLPSSKYLARAIARQIDLDTDQPVVELGVGTGSVTQALLNTGIDPNRLIVVEKDIHFCALLCQRFPQLRVVQRDACQLGELLKTSGITAASSVVSSLPLLSMPRFARERIIRQSLSLLREKGHFIQFTYGLGSPLAGFDLCGQAAARIWLNFPPASVWNFQEQ